MWPLSAELAHRRVMFVWYKHARFLRWPGIRHAPFTPSMQRTYTVHCFLAFLELWADKLFV